MVTNAEDVIVAPDAPAPSGDVGDPSVAAVTTVTSPEQSEQLSPEELLDNAAAMLEVCRADGNALRTASKRLRADREFMLAVPHRHGDAVRWASDELRSDTDFMLAMVNHSGSAFTIRARRMLLPRTALCGCMPAPLYPNAWRAFVKGNDAGMPSNTRVKVCEGIGTSCLQRYMYSHFRLLCLKMCCVHVDQVESVRASICECQAAERLVCTHECICACVDVSTLGRYTAVSLRVRIC